MDTEIGSITQVKGWFEGRDIPVRVDEAGAVSLGMMPEDWERGEGPTFWPVATSVTRMEITNQDQPEALRIKLLVVTGGELEGSTSQSVWDKIQSQFMGIPLITSNTGEVAQ